MTSLGLQILYNNRLLHFHLPGLDIIKVARATNLFFPEQTVKNASLLA
jgi:hypothetical protein